MSMIGGGKGAAARLLLDIRANSGQAVAEMSRTEKAIHGLKRASTVAATAAATALAGMAAAGVREFATFDKGMREVFTLLPGITEKAMGEMSDQVLRLSEDLGVLPKDVVPALYQAISAGVPQDNVFGFMETAVKTSIGGVTDLETAVDGLTTATNAYGTANLSVEEAADVMFTTVRLGKTNMEELSKFLFQVVPIAAAVGVSFEEVGAALAAVTAQGVPTRVAATQIRSAIAEMSKEGAVAFGHFEDASGKTFPDFIRAGGTLREALDIMAGHAEGMGTNVNNLFGSLEGGMAALQLASDQGAAVFAANMDAMAGKAGAAGMAFETMDDGVARSFDRIKAKISTTLIEIGETLAPQVERLADTFTDKLPGFASGLVGLFGNVAVVIDNTLTGIGMVGELLGRVPEPARNAAFAIGGVAAALALASAHPIIVGLGAIVFLVQAIGSSSAEAQREASILRHEMEQLGGLSLETVADVIGHDDIARYEELGGSLHTLRDRMLEGSDAFGAWAERQREAARASGMSGSELVAYVGVLVEAHKLLMEMEEQQRRFREPADFFTGQRGDLWNVEGLADAAGPMGDLDAELEALLNNMEGFGSTAEEQTQKVVSAFSAVPEQVQMSIDELQQVFTENIEAQGRWNANLEKLTRLGLDDVRSQFEQAGPTYSSALDTLLNEPMLDTLFAMEQDLDDFDSTIKAEVESWLQTVQSTWDANRPRLTVEITAGGDGVNQPGRGSHLPPPQAPPITVNVGGSVVSERELTEVIRGELIKIGSRNGDSGIR